LTRHAIDRTIDLDVNGSRQRIRLCAEQEGRPPLLIVQGGPGLPLLNEVRKYQRLLDLERDFLVGYWEQRGCGDAPARDTDGVSMLQQVSDLRTVLRWFFEHTRQPVSVLAISIGGTFALLAAEHESDHLEAIVAVSPDLQTATGDAAADAFIRTRAGQHANRATRQRAVALPTPPYTDPAAFQQRVRLLGDLGGIEHGKTFGALLREALLSIVRTYGVAGAMRTLRNMNRIQRGLMPQINSLDLLVSPPRIAVPVHFVFGDSDPLNPPALVNSLPTAIAAPATTVTVVADAGHMVHFDHPTVVRSILVNTYAAQGHTP
jgi:pimeloyl-ACP methyl ester carboxylesterase